MRASPIQSDFSTGEISPLAYGRVDADRYKSALATCFNALPIPQGGVTRRSGTRFVAEVKDSSKKTILVPFEFSTEEAYILEFGDNYVRFYANQGQVLSGGFVYEIASPFPESMLDEIRFTQSADTLYLVHPKVFPRKLLRYGPTDWQFQTIAFQDGPYGPVNTSQITLAPSATSGMGVAVNMLPTQTITGCANNGAGKVRVAVTGHGWSVGDLVHIVQVSGTTEANGSWRIIGVPDPNHFDIPVNFVHTYSSTPTPGAVIPLGPAGHGIPELFGDNMIGCPVRIQHGSTWGWGIITGTFSGMTIYVNVISPFGATSASKNWRIGVWRPEYFNSVTGITTEASYPSAVGFYEDRLCFAGSTENPLRLDGSRTGDYENFSPTDVDGTVPSDAAISFNLNQAEMNKAQWIAKDERALLMGATGSESAIKGSTTTEALSATNVSAKEVDNFGSANVAPIRVGKNTLFVQRARKKIGELAYYFDIDGFKTTDLSLLAEHVTRPGVKQIAFQRQPIPLVWAVLDNGTLAALSYNRDSDGLRVGWHRHEIAGVSDASGTNAEVESIAIIPSPDVERYDVWMVVHRFINGQHKRYIEFIERFFDDGVDQLDAFFVDCGLSYDGVPANNISGLDHLEGQTVSILGDGFAFPDQVVTGGAITLSRECSKIHVGLGFKSDVKLLPINAGAQDGTSVGKKRRINSFGIMLRRTLGLLYGMSFDEPMDEIITRDASDDVGSAIPLFSGQIEDVPVSSSHDTSNQLCFRQDKPLPMTILSVQPQQVVQDKG